MNSNIEFCSIKQIKSMYNELGLRVESGLFSQGDSTFGLISNAVLEIWKLLNCHRDGLSQESPGLRTGFDVHSMHTMLVLGSVTKRLSRMPLVSDMG